MHRMFLSSISFLPPLPSSPYLHMNTSYYPNLSTKLVGGLPRIRFFVDEQDAKNSTVDPANMGADKLLELLAILKEDPDHFSPKKSTVEVLIARETTLDEIITLLERFGVQRVFTFDEGLRPVIDETGDDRPDNRPFDHDAALRAVDPEHTVATPDPEYVKRMEEEERRALEEERAQAAAEKKNAAAATSDATVADDKVEQPTKDEL